MMDVQELIAIDEEILGGQAVFKGTRVPVESLFDHLEAGVSLDEFLDDFPSVSKEQAITYINIKTGLDEIGLFKQGKLKTTSANDFLNEL